MKAPEPPIVTVVIPARNEEAYIEAALTSVVAQRYPKQRLNCIVVDNGSGDSTASLARRFAASHPDVSIAVLSEPEAGVGRAKNLGAGMAGGDVLVFLDADSRMSRNLAADVAASLQSRLLCGSIRVTADSRHPIDRGFFALMELGKVLFGVRGQMLYCERELFLSVGGFRPDLHLAEDLEFLDRVRARLKERGDPPVCHIRTSAIATSPRRLRSKPFHLGIVSMFARWALAFAGIGRTRKY